MKRIERLLTVMSIALLAALAALAGCSGGGGDSPPPPPPQKTSGTWVWTSGTDTVRQPGVYGTRGASTVPGARAAAVSQTDGSGNLWLFGGSGRDSADASGYLNDLWKFDGTNWIWSGGTYTADQPGVYGTKGQPDPANIPGGRESAASWIDGSGNLWLFGGAGHDSAGGWGYLNDLWKFDGTNATWVSGSDTGNQAGNYGTKGVAGLNNTPGGRTYAVSWIDADGNLWLFGGFGCDSTGTWGYLNDLWKFNPVTSLWTWVSGTTTTNQPGTYGTKGAADPNNAPGARYAAVSLTGADGTFWLFGGFGFDSSNPANPESYLNDLWKFDPDTSLWTWVSGADTANQEGTYGTKGIADALNVPGARGYSTSWRGADGALWLFGGSGYISGGAMDRLNDLWKFDPATSLWTWVSGSDTVAQWGDYGTKRVASSSNVPGGRDYGVSWTDAHGDLWLFGGFGYDSGVTQGLLNDLWKFDPATSEWTWVSGSDTIDQKGAYGDQGKTNVPGARDTGVSWADADGNLWLFGGYGLDSAGADGWLNDLWRFDGADWTWVSGADTGNQPGVYGTKGQADPANVPGGRYGAVSWRDANGNLWLFGGSGFDSTTGSPGNLNDLWKFDGANWTWVSGSDIREQPGVYGNKGEAAPGNVPGARIRAASWVDGSGNLWLFGGQYNDLWKFDPVTSQWTWVSGSNIPSQLGVYGTKGVASASNVPGARDGAASWTDADGNFWLFGGYGVDQPPSGEGPFNDLWKFTPATSEWTWVSGSNTAGQHGVYGTTGIASASNVPGAREGTASWIDGSGNLWLFGGEGLDYSANLPMGELNDLWKFDPATSKWTWVSGPDTVDQPGVYGAKGVAGGLNVPGARRYPVSWIDRDGNFWLFGGNGQASAVGQGDELNDLWCFTPR